MAKGVAEKQHVTDKILEMFDGAFVYGKEIRVPVGDVQIKVVLTCANKNVPNRGGEEIPGEVEAEQTEASAPVKATEEEKENLAKLMAELF